MPSKTSSTGSTPRKKTSRPSSRPSSRPNLWPRRIITGTGLLLILTFIVWGVVALVGWIMGPQATPESGQSGAQSGALAKVKGLKPGQEATRDGIIDTNETMTIPVCAVEDLQVSATPASTVVGAGEKVAITMTNRSEVACMSALGEFSMRIVTGDEVVYDSAKCEDRDQSATPLLLSPDTEWSGTLDWDGKKHSGGCGAPAESDEGAPAGTYRVQVMRSGRPMTVETAFTIDAPPPPQSGQVGATN